MVGIHGQTMTNFFDQLSRVKGTKFIWSFWLTNQLTIGQNDNFTRVATKMWLFWSISFYSADCLLVIFFSSCGILVFDIIKYSEAFVIIQYSGYLFLHFVTCNFCYALIRSFFHQFHVVQGIIFGTCIPLTRLKSMIH